MQPLLYFRRLIEDCRTGLLASKPKPHMLTDERHIAPVVLRCVELGDELHRNVWFTTSGSCDQLDVQWLLLVSIKPAKALVEDLSPCSFV